MHVTNDQAGERSDTSPEHPLSLTGVLGLAGLWVILPLIFRIDNFLDQPTHLITLVNGLMQDLAVGGQAILFALIVTKPLRLGFSWFLGMSLFLLFLCNTYFIVDYFLYVKMGIRMAFSHLLFLTDPMPFLTSAQSLNPGFGLTGIAIVGLGSLILYRLLRLKADSYQVITVVSVAVPLLILGSLSYLLQDKRQSEVFANALLKGQMSALGRDRSLANDETTVSYAIPKSPYEDFETVDPLYPLLKNTQGFDGVKTFDVKIDSGEKPHIVFLFLESYRGRDVGVLGGQYNASPEFDKLASEGVLFSNFYATGVQTTRAVISSLYGILPRFSNLAVQSHQSEIPLIGLPNILSKSGYRIGYFHNGSLAFEKKLEFFGSHHYDEVWGGDDIALAFPDTNKANSWGLDDEYLMKFVIDWLVDQDKFGPAFLTMFTVSNHHPWIAPAWYNPPTFDIDPELEHARYLNSFNYTDYSLGLFMKMLRDHDLARKTVVFVLADTSTPMGEHHDNHTLINYLYEENLHIPLLILADGRLEPTIVTELGSQVDLLPTVMDIFDLKGLNHSIGTSLARRAHDRRIFFNNPFHLSFLGTRQANLKFIYSLSDKQTQVFDLVADKGERTNIASDEDQFVKQSFIEISRLLKVHDFAYEEEKFISTELLREYQNH